MGLILVLMAVGILLVGGLLSALLGRRDLGSLRVGAGATLAASATGMVGAAWAIHGGEDRLVAAPWSLPVGTLSVGIDALSAFFLLVIFLVTGLGALYGLGYFASDAGRRRLAPAAALSPALAASMAAVVLARDAVAFLLAWEAMTFTSFFLVTYEGERSETRRAGVTYLAASQLGVVPLFVLFLLLAQAGGGTDFDSLARGVSPDLAGVVFVLAVLGFGLKAGFWPLHIWLPEAHPAAPSPVSAVMSGALIKTGIYGILRVLTLLPTPPAWWGVVLLVIGATSGLGGVLHALAQHDLKRLLAYHSIENIGIIALGLGLGLLGQAWGDGAVAFLGYAGCVLHVLNHAIFKGLLFQGAGNVQHACGTRDFDALGGLLKRMPVTGTTFLVGSAAISGLPPFNGFISEVLLFAAAFRAAAVLPSGGAVPGLAAAPVLAAIGGLAVACFVKAFGVVFLGEPRSPAARDAHEAPGSQRLAMRLGAFLCIAIGMAPLAVLPLVSPVASSLARTGLALPPWLAPLLTGTTVVGGMVVALTLLLALARHALLRGRDVRPGTTWGCGYEAPTARMQYTAASFADPVLAPALPVLDRQVHREGPDGPFPAQARYQEHLGDRVSDRLVAPALQWAAGVLGRLERLHDGRVERYLVYVLATLVGLLAWHLGHG